MVLEYLLLASKLLSGDHKTKAVRTDPDPSTRSLFASCELVTMLTVTMNAGIHQDTGQGRHEGQCHVSQSWWTDDTPSSFLEQIFASLKRC